MLKIKRTWVAVFLSVGLITGVWQPVFAEANDYHVQVTPFAGYRFGGTFEDTDTNQEYDLANDLSYGLTVNFPSINNTEWEIYYSRQETEIDIAGFSTNGEARPFEVDYLQLGGTYLFEETKYAVPYIVATIGATFMEPEGPNAKSDTFLSFGIGGGWKFFPTSRFGLRLDGRLLGSFIDSNSRVFCQSGQGGSCAINVSGKVFYQFEMQAGITVRF